MNKKLILSTLVCGLIFSTPNIAITSTAYASDNAIEKNFDNVSNNLKNYLEIDNQGNYYINLEVAKDNGESEEVLRTGLLFNTITDFSKLYPNKVSALFSSIPDDSEAIFRTGWGNYCGFGNNGGDPIDILDYFCQLHDDCYTEKGWGNNTCDSQFVDNLKNNMTAIKKLGSDAAIYANHALRLFQILKHF